MAKPSKDTISRSLLYITLVYWANLLMNYLGFVFLDKTFHP